MEEVLEKMETALTSLEPKVEKTSSFEGLYKNWGRVDNQEERRKEQLEIQKGNRNTKLDVYRGILDLVNATQENDIFRSHKKAYYRPSIYVSGFSKAPSNYYNILMMSEWMIEKPSDLAENWYATPCPKGTRMLVVATQGITKCYNKYGAYKFTTHSTLPGGNWNDKRSTGTKDKYCILDCFYVDSNNTMYVLDFLAWNNQAMTECDTEFRNYWLQTQFSEHPELGVVSKRNKTRFVLLPKVLCTTEELNKFMMTYPHFENNILLDGILFYHKQAHYVSGETPLVGWLFPYMVPEVLGADIKLHKVYELQKPVDYVNQAEFIKKFDEKHAKRKIRGRGASNAMDTAEVKEIKRENEVKAQDSASASTLDVKPASAAMEAEDSAETSIDKNEMENNNEELLVVKAANSASECTLDVKPTSAAMEAEDSGETSIDKNEMENNNEELLVAKAQDNASGGTLDVKPASAAMEAEDSAETSIDKSEMENNNDKLLVGSTSEAKT